MTKINKIKEKKRKRYYPYFLNTWNFAGYFSSLSHLASKYYWYLNSGGKGIFVSEEKLEENWPKVEAIDNKVKKGIAAKPLNWLSQKIQDTTTRDFLRGDLKAFVKAMRLYSGILLFIWFISVIIFWTIFYHLTAWIIGKFIWKEPNLSE